MFPSFWRLDISNESRYIEPPRALEGWLPGHLRVVAARCGLVPRQRLLEPRVRVASPPFGACAVQGNGRVT